MHRPGFALVPRSRAPLVAGETLRTQWLQSITLGGVISLLLLIVGMPVVSIALMAVVTASTLAVLAATPSPAQDSIVSLDARHTYRAIVAACEEIEAAVAEAPPAPASARIRDRCRTAVDVSARVAYLANPLQRYLESHDPTSIRAELERLRARTEQTTDERTVAALSRATAARARQLETHDEIRTIRDRIQARLELVQASLEAFAAQLVKLRVVEDEQLVLAGDTIADRVDGIGDDLDILESALSMNPA